MNFIFKNVDYGRDLFTYIEGTCYTYAELVSSDLAIRHNICNIPNAQQWVNLELLVQNIIQPLTDKFGKFQIVSCFRNPILSALIGSSSNCLNTKGESIDLALTDEQSSTITIKDVFHELISEKYTFNELTVESMPYGWFSISYKDSSRLKTFKIKDNIHNFSKVSKEYMLDYLS